jgi:hypothetical protein
MSGRYEVILGPAAIRTTLGVSDADRKELADALRTELMDGPNADKEVGFDADLRPCVHSDRGRVYTGTPLSFGAYLAVHRLMTKEELKRLRREQGRRVAAVGFLVFDILHPASAFARRPQFARRS